MVAGSAFIRVPKSVPLRENGAWPDARVKYQPCGMFGPRGVSATLPVEKQAAFPGECFSSSRK